MTTNTSFDKLTFWFICFPVKRKYFALFCFHKKMKIQILIVLMMPRFFGLATCVPWFKLGSKSKGTVDNLQNRGVWYKKPIIYWHRCVGSYINCNKQTVSLNIGIRLLCKHTREEVLKKGYLVYGPASLTSKRRVSDSAQNFHLGINEN